MRHFLVGSALGIVLAVPLLLGCNHTPVIGKREEVKPLPPGTKADPPSLVRYLNENARRVSAVQSNRVEMDCKQGRQAVGLDGMLVCQKPRDFRLRAKVLANPTVDIGSNDREFWYWISKATPPYVYHCSYSDMSTSKVNLPFPFQPDMVVAALGLAEYDAKARYELKEVGRYLELSQDVTTSAGKPARRVTVFNKIKVAAPNPQVVGHILRDNRGKLICQATIHRVAIDRGTGAILPTWVTLEWPAQEMKMTLKMNDLRAVKLDATRSARLFQRTDLTSYDSFDLARGRIDTPGAVRRAAGWSDRDRPSYRR
jgi:hypothetical protein